MSAHLVRAAICMEPNRPDWALALAFPSAPKSATSHFDVRCCQQAVFRAEHLTERLQGRDPAKSVLFTVPAAQSHPADHLVINDDRISADESRKPAFEAQLDSEGFVAREGWPVRRTREQMRRALVPSGRERLI